MSAIKDLIRGLRMAAASAKRTRDRTGRFDTTTVYFAMPAHVALLAADRLEATDDRLVANAKFKSDMQNIVDIAEETMKDNNLRFHHALADLELLLMEAGGREPLTVQEVREQRQIHEARPSPGPQPFVRRKPATQISPELIRSLRERKIGNPREPGEDG